MLMSLTISSPDIASYLLAQLSKKADSSEQYAGAYRARGRSPCSSGSVARQDAMSWARGLVFLFSCDATKQHTTHNARTAPHANHVTRAGTMELHSIGVPGAE